MPNTAAQHRKKTAAQTTETMRAAMDAVASADLLQAELDATGSGRVLLKNPNQKPITTTKTKHHGGPPPPTRVFAPPSNASRKAPDVQVDGYGHFSACCCGQNETLWKRELERSRAEALELAANYRKLQLRCAIHVARRIARRRVTVCFEEWTHRTLLKKRYRKCFISLHGARLSRMLRGWCWQARKLRNARRLIRKMRQAKAHAALQSWATHADDERRRRANARRVVLRMLNLAASRAFSAWHAVLVEKRRLRQSLERCVHRMQRAKEYAAWRKWKTAREDRLNAQRMGRYAINKLAKRKLAIAFAGYVDGVDHQVRMRSIGVRVIMRFTHAKLAAAWEAWAFRIRELARLANLSHKAVQMFQGGCLRRAFAKWSMEADPEFKMRQKEERARRRREVKRTFKRCAEQEKLLREMVDEVSNMRERMRKDMGDLKVPMRGRHVPTTLSPNV